MSAVRATARMLATEADARIMGDLELSTAELPEAMRAWLEAQPAVIVSVEQIGPGRVLVRPLADVDPQLVARARVTMAKYREALMNLT